MVFKKQDLTVIQHEKNGLQQFQMESCQPYKILKDKKKMELNRLKLDLQSHPS
jgi:hypothetical protein